MKIITINSVGGFLKKLENVLDTNKTYFYRGEDLDYSNSKLTATLYRGKPDSQNDKKNFEYNMWKTFLNASLMFYKNLPNLNEVDKKNFMALCQHHGIPTPLLDLSTSPLVALYFAAQKSKLTIKQNKQDRQDGRVFVFPKDNFIPLNNKILSHSYLIKCFKDDNYFPLYFTKLQSIIDITQPIKEFIINANKCQKDYYRKLVNTSISELLSYKRNYKLNSYTLMYLKELKLYNNCFKLWKYIDNIDKGIFSPRLSLLASSYVNFLRLFGIRRISEMYRETKDGRKIPIIQFYDVKNKEILKNSSIPVYYTLLPFLIYLGNHCLSLPTPFVPSKLNFYTSCTFNWGRVKAQKSKFIIQMPFKPNKKDYNHSMKNKDIPDDSVDMSKASIVYTPQPKYVFSINNKEKILKELDLLGINKMSLFMDKDSIANYIKNKYYI